MSRPDTGALADATPGGHPVRAVRFDVSPGQSVSGLWTIPAESQAVYVFAHGAGAGMDHASMSTVADGLATRGIATLRYQFPFMENGSRRPDVPAVAHAAVRAAVRLAVDWAGQHLPDAGQAGRVFAGGRSFGGRMTSQAQARQPLPGIAGLVFLAFPLHPPEKPGVERASHLNDVRVPMLFVQGTQDKLAEPALIEQVTRQLGDRATLMTIEHADHSFHVLKRTGRTDAEVLREVLDGAAAWMIRHAQAPVG